MRSNSALKGSYQVPPVAKLAGMSFAAGRNHASAKPSLSWALCPPCRWVTIGTGPVSRPGVAVNDGRMSRPAAPPDGFAQWSVWSTASRCGRKWPLASIRSLIHLTLTGLRKRASMVNAG